MLLVECSFNHIPYMDAACRMTWTLLDASWALETTTATPKNLHRYNGFWLVFETGKLAIDQMLRVPHIHVKSRETGEMQSHPMQLQLNCSCVQKLLLVMRHHMFKPFILHKKSRQTKQPKAWILNPAGVQNVVCMQEEPVATAPSRHFHASLIQQTNMLVKI